MRKAERRQAGFANFSAFSVQWAAGTNTAVAGTLARSAGTLMASAGTPYRLVPAHFYPCVQQKTGQKAIDSLLTILHKKIY